MSRTSENTYPSAATRAINREMGRPSTSGAGRLQTALTLMEGTAPPPRLLPRANLYALRMLRRTIRASEEARRLVHDTPRSGINLLLIARLRQIALASAAVVAMVVLRSGVLVITEEGQRLGEQLAQTHLDRHVYGDLDELDT